MNNKFPLILIIICFILMNGCKEKTESTQVSASQKSEIIKTDFGQLSDGTMSSLYTLTNKNGVKVSITDYGGIIVSVMVPDKSGVMADVVLGYDSVALYEKNNPYFGAIIGRYGNRIAKGKFSIDGKSYQLATNDNTNHLHGGVKGYDKVMWNVQAVEGEEPALVMTYLSKDMEEGYPGNLENKVTYTLTNENAIKIDFEATTDKPTIVNMCNHSYFNLNGGQSDILDHSLKIFADKYCAVDKTLIPLVGLAEVANTPFDFRAFKNIGTDINKDDIQLKNGLGYDHCWVLNQKASSGMILAAILQDSVSGRTLTVETTEPGIQFYSGNFLDGTIVGKYGVKYNKRSGLCLETQHFPDSPNRPDFPSTLLNPGEKYASTTTYTFGLIQ
ncbi:MAG TPA: aldose epimerase family protein [Saprospiraceae bacterium]|nr:aldose epimerase family protein [Saprospiraceae bacterium]